MVYQKSAIALVVFGLVATACSSADPTATPSTAAKLGVCAKATRTHYVAADTVEWNYAPLATNAITGKPFSDDENVFVKTGPDRIGSTYTKSLYREYTDASFATLAAQSDDWRHLGALGPVIHAEVGDTIKFVFKNNTKFPTGVHPHGVRYTKSSEGAPYDDGTDDKGDDSVAPGDTYTYTWEVPERSGPGPMEGSSTMWMYMGHTDEVGDAYAGLIGPMIVTRCGMARADGSPKDVDRELVMNFMVEDENQSPWIDDNIAKYATEPASVEQDSDEFGESNLMHSINGYVYGNQPVAKVHKGERVRWYLMGMGTEVDLHTPHWHGNTVINNGMRSDVVSLLPASMATADMQPDAVGTWLFHCHVTDHILAGMVTRYEVTPN